MGDLIAILLQLSQYHRSMPCSISSPVSWEEGNDTGPVFLAAKIGVPTLMMMGPDTDPSMSAPIGISASWLRATPISGITVPAALASLYDLGEAIKS